MRNFVGAASVTVDLGWLQHGSYIAPVGFFTRAENSETDVK
jgi:hypothetical protein